MTLAGPLLFLLAAATAPSDGDIARLVRELGHDDFEIRERATARLTEIGKPALVELRKAVTSDDPEVKSRAQALVRRIERRVPPAWNTRIAPDGSLVGRNVHVTVGDGSKTIEVDEGGMHVRIISRAGAIEVTVSGMEDGRTLSETYRADNVEQLKRNSPEAAELYERWGGGPGPAWVMRVGGGARVVADGELNVARMVVEDELSIYRGRLEEQMRQANTAEDQRRWLRDHIEKMQAVSGARRGGGGTTEEYLKLVDELRDKLSELKLPDPGAALPPGARERLGISIRPPDPDAGGPDGLLVMEVGDGSRGAKIGLREGDIIRKVSGKPVASVPELRRLLIESKGAVVVEVDRGGESVELREKR